MKWMLTSLGLCVTVAAQNVYLTGTVSDATGSPIAGSSVELSKRAISTTTGSDGVYVISSGATRTYSNRTSGLWAYEISDGRLSLDLNRETVVNVRALDIRGRSVQEAVSERLAVGRHSVLLFPSRLAPQTGIVSVGLDNHNVTHRVVSLRGMRVVSRPTSRTPDRPSLAKTAAVPTLDTLRATDATHGSVKLYVYSYIDTMDFTLGENDQYTEERQQCVHRTNYYRSTIGMGPLTRRTDQDSCVDSQCESDAASGTAHGAFGRCSESAQNECPGWRSLTSIITGCLQSMWDEGPPPVPPDSCTGTCYQSHGHYINMTNPRYSSVACGFYVTAGNRVWAIQNFWR